MFPYRFDPTPNEQEPSATPPAPARPDERRPQYLTKTRNRRLSRWATTSLIAVALVGSTIGGGLVGSYATSRQLIPNLPLPPPQAIVSQGAPPTSLAGEVFNKVNPAVVQLVVSGPTPAGSTRFGSGSGFVADARGLILTNNHVVENARAVTVRFSSGATREAEVLGTDRGNDLALLKVDLPLDVPVAPLGDSDAVATGDLAIAIGSPFGLAQSVTQGIVSAVQRTWSPGSGRVLRNLIQTDAPLNPGNSGGPLLNARGEVVGINNMIESPVRGSVGVGFAVPINVAKRLMPQLEAGARLEPVWLGIAGQQLDPTIARDQGLSVQSGVLVTSVVPDGPAARAGLRGVQAGNERIPRGGDVITALDGTPVADLSRLTDLLAGKQPGEQVTLTIVRNGQEHQFPVTLAAWPAQTS